MAVRNHPAMYAGGAVVLDSTPSVNLYANLLQRRQAKIDALDEYDRNRINNINGAGVRDKDRQIFDKKLDDIRGYYNSNKDKIRKGNTPEAYQYEKMFREQHSLINRSKNRSALSDAGMKFIQDKIKQDGVIPDDLMKEYAANEMGLEEEGSQEFNIPKWLAAPKPYNRDKSNKPYTLIKRTPGTPFTEPITGNPLRVNEVTEEKYDDKAKEQIQFMAANDFENSYSFREEVKKEFDDPVKRVQMAKVFKDLKGVDPASMDDYAFAYKMQELQPVIRKERQIDNKVAIIDKNQANRQANIRLSSALGVGAWKDKYTFDKVATELGVDKNNVTADGLISGATKADGTIEIEPELLGVPNYGTNLRIAPNKTDIQYDINYTDKDGNITNTETKTITRESGKKFMANKLDIKVVPQVPQKSNVNQQPKPSQKVETVAEKMRRLAGQKK